MIGKLKQTSLKGLQTILTATVVSGVAYCFQKYNEIQTEKTIKSLQMQVERLQSLADNTKKNTKDIYDKIWEQNEKICENKIESAIANEKAICNLEIIKLMKR